MFNLVVLLSKNKLQIKMKKQKNLEFKVIPVDGITLGKEIFENIKIGDRIHWERGNGRDKYWAVVIEKNLKYFFAVSKEYIEEQPEHYMMGFPGKVKSEWGNSFREKGFELTEENKIWYKGDYGRTYTQSMVDVMGLDYAQQYSEYDLLLKKNKIPMSKFK